MKSVEYYTAAWCGPCRQFSPIFEELRSEFPGVEFTKFDIDANAGAAQAARITSVPTIIIKDDGAVLEKFVGVQAKATLENALNA